VEDGHAVQLTALLAKVPAGQIRQNIAPLDDADPAEHGKHCCEGASAYVPPGHSEHAEPVKTDPAAHCVQVVEDAGWYPYAQCTVGERLIAVF
jgi:hypothetical protein